MIDTCKSSSAKTFKKFNVIVDQDIFSYKEVINDFINTPNNQYNPIELLVSVNRFICFPFPSLIINHLMNV